MDTRMTRQPVHCTSCGTGPLIYVAPGEAHRLTERTRVVCPGCYATPTPLTKRESDMIEVSRRLRMTDGRAPTYGEIAEAMGLSASRVSSIAGRLREKGMGNRLRDARFGTDMATEDEPRSEVAL